MRLLLLLALIAFPQIPLCAPLEEIELGGHFKSLNLLLQSSPSGAQPSAELSSNQLRIDLRSQKGPFGEFELSVENILVYTDPAKAFSLPERSINQHLDLEKDWNEEGRFKNRLLIDRLSLTKEFKNLEITLGRQAVGFGRISLFSPLDIIAPFSPEALDTSVRPGVDALRLSRYVGISGQIGFISVFGDGNDNNSYLATAEGNVNGIDILAIVGQLRQRTTVGLGVAGQIGGMGLKIEGALYKGDKENLEDGDLHDEFGIAGIEIDYRFESEWTLFVQYLHNGAGAGNPEDYIKALSSAPLREGLSFLLGRNYLITSPSYEFHPLVNFTTLNIINLDDSSWFLRPLVNLSLSDNLSLQSFWSFTQGNQGSEFGSQGNSGGIFLQYFF